MNTFDAGKRTGRHATVAGPEILVSGAARSRLRSTPAIDAAPTASRGIAQSVGIRSGDGPQRAGDPSPSDTSRATTAVFRTDNARNIIAGTSWESSMMNQRQRQIFDTGLLILAVVVAVLRAVEHLWDSAAIAAAAGIGLLWFQRRSLRPGLWSWLNGRGWHWIDEPRSQP